MKSDHYFPLFVLPIENFGAVSRPCAQSGRFFKLKNKIMAKGKVARFFDQKGYGFIEPEGGGKDLFCHINEVEGGQLQEGDTVEYEETEGRKGMQASGVKVV